MLVIRPVKLSDHAAILEMAKLAGIGFTSLPPDADVLRDKIENAVNSFQGNPKHPGEEVFLFVMEDMANGSLAGSTGIYAHVGLSRPFYSYKLSIITQASSTVDIYSMQRVLHMVNDYTGVTEIGSLFLRPEYRRDGIGRFLSRARYLMLADQPQLFSDTVISEIRGVQDDQGGSPFYDNLGRHFFQMDFKQADYINATRGGQFISDLMPKYPIYVNLLPEAAQHVIGQPHSNSRAAMHMLQAEGFHHQGYVDVFDAGPTLQADREDIRTVAKSKHAVIAAIAPVESHEEYLVANGCMPDFRMVRVCLKEQEDATVVIDAETASALKVKQGDALRYIAA